MAARHSSKHQKPGPHWFAVFGEDIEESPRKRFSKLGYREQEDSARESFGPIKPLVAREVHRFWLRKARLARAVALLRNLARNSQRWLYALKVGTTGFEAVKNQINGVK